MSLKLAGDLFLAAWSGRPIAEDEKRLLKLLAKQLYIQDARRQLINSLCVREQKLLHGENKEGCARAKLQEGNKLRLNELPLWRREHIIASLGCSSQRASVEMFYVCFASKLPAFVKSPAAKFHSFTTF